MDKLAVRKFFSDYEGGKYGTLSDGQILDLIINMLRSDDTREAELGRDLYKAFKGE